MLTRSVDRFRWPDGQLDLSETAAIILATTLGYAVLGFVAADLAARRLRQTG